MRASRDVGPILTKRLVDYLGLAIVLANVLEIAELISGDRLPLENHAITIRTPSDFSGLPIGKIVVYAMAGLIVLCALLGSIIALPLLFPIIRLVEVLVSLLIRIAV